MRPPNAGVEEGAGVERNIVWKVEGGLESKCLDLQSLPALSRGRGKSSEILFSNAGGGNECKRKRIWYY